MDEYFDAYGDLGLHRRMVFDRPRTEAFARGIKALVRPGDVVLDVGTGTGLLAMLAARAGARRVIAIDQAEVARAAVRLVRANGLSEQVAVKLGPVEALELDEKVDVIVSEWLGNCAFVENMLVSVLGARDRWLKPGGRMLPGKVQVKLAPLHDAVGYRQKGPGAWRRMVEGLDFSSLEQDELSQGRAVQDLVDPMAVAAPPAEIAALDLADAAATAPSFEGAASFRFPAAGTVDGLVAWFDLELAPGVSLSTAPEAPETHWAQTYLPLAPRPVSAGETWSFRYRLTPDAAEPRWMRLALEGLHVPCEYLIT